MCNSSFVVARVMHFFIHTNQCFNCLIKITKTQYLFDQIAHISAYDKARTSHESSLKGSDSTFSDGLNSFQNCSMMAPVTVQSSSCPPCNSFSRIFQNLILAHYCHFSKIIVASSCITVNPKNFRLKARSVSPFFVDEMRVWYP